nr:MAG TPA: hypothetical protein [Caudoviricetes sp.]
MACKQQLTTRNTPPDSSLFLSAVLEWYYVPRKLILP